RRGHPFRASIDLESPGRRTGLVTRQDPRRRRAWWQPFPEAVLEIGPMVPSLARPSGACEFVLLLATSPGA
ncbi:MAG: hypothetical protein ACC726_15790, partial [Chloroflexota bacterium]